MSFSGGFKQIDRDYEEKDQSKLGESQYENDFSRIISPVPTGVLI